MDPGKNGMFLSTPIELTKSNFGDTTLRLDCSGYGRSKNTVFGINKIDNRARSMHTNAPDDGCSLVLGLDPTPCAYSENYYPINNKKKAMMATLSQGLPADGNSILKLCLSGGSDEVSNIVDYSASTHSTTNASHHSDQVSSDGNIILIPVVDEGSTSAKRSGGYLTTFFIEPRTECRKPLQQTKELFELDAKSHCPHSQLSSERSVVSDYSRSTISGSATAATSADHRTNNPKRCKFDGCKKGARGATDLCIGHGGGQRCQKPGCNKGAESRTAYCKAHGGGKRCQELGCTKSAEGRTDYCIAHGGGRRCGYQGGCTKAARGKSGLCIRHGGGKRCKIEDCTRSAEGQIGLCISHGGGRRCQFQGCSKGAQGSTIFCKAHGGGKRCIVSGCTKGAEGSTPLCKGHGGGKRCLFDGVGICPKSVHGGTNFCVAHGGGKRCSVPGCTKSARGRTDCCVRHGGGKRCKFENCDKSAQGSTDFCKAHGGGKRCYWGGGKCEKFARGKSGLCAAHSSLVQGQETNKRGMIGPGLFHGLVSTASTVKSNIKNYSSCGGSMISESVDFIEKPAKGQHLIPLQVLVPLSMKASSSHSKTSSTGKEEERNTGVDIGGSSDEGNNLSFMVQGQEMNKRGMIGPGLVHGLVCAASTVKNDIKNYSSSGGSMISESVDFIEKPAKRQHLIPPQVLVPLSMKASSSHSKTLSTGKEEERNTGVGIGSSSDEGNNLGFMVPEGRVHGGGLMSLLGGNLRNAMNEL